MSKKALKSFIPKLLAGILAGSFFFVTQLAHGDAKPAVPAPEAAPATTPVAATMPPAEVTAIPSAAPSSSAVWHARFSERYKRIWGVDIGGVRSVSSGYMLRLNYRVLDPDKAKPLFDKKSKPYLIDEKSGARLAVPAMENIGELRQTAAPVGDRQYFIIFGNPGKLVQPGNRVSIVIGDFRADGVIVD